MKPRTLLQKNVAALSKGLQPITERQRNYAIRHCFDHVAYLRKNGESVCMECGARWKTAQTEKDVCPYCKTKLKLMSTSKRVISTNAYFMVLTASSDFQVLRFFFCTQSCRAGEKASYRVDEVSQVWLNSRMEMVVIAARRRAMSRYYDDWIVGSELEVRSTRCRTSYWYNIFPDAIYPYKRILPELRRNGFSGDFHGIRPLDLFHGLLGNSRIETLFKAGQYELTGYFAGGRPVEPLWDSIRICLRNRYRVDNASLWVDTVRILSNLGRDVRNAHYVCPENLVDAHDRWQRLYRERLNTEQRNRLNDKIEACEKAFVEMRRRFFGLLLQDGELTVCPLQSVRQVYDEGEAMHHCVFQSDYFKRENSLLLSARVNGERMETVEVSLTELTVVQSRGRCNMFTPYHERIVDLVTRNMGLIGKLDKQAG